MTVLSASTLMLSVIYGDFAFYTSSFLKVDEKPVGIDENEIQVQVL